jgi:hypothetical protein
LSDSDRPDYELYRSAYSDSGPGAIAPNVADDSLRHLSPAPDDSGLELSDADNSGRDLSDADDQQLSRHDRAGTPADDYHAAAVLSASDHDAARLSASAADHPEFSERHVSDISTFLLSHDSNGLYRRAG